jgi:hypothetical protein
LIWAGYAAELLRIKGELAILESSPDAVAVAEGHFLQALDCARPRNEALNCTPCVRSLIQLPLAWTNSPAAIITA